MNTVRYIEAPQQLTNPQVPAEGTDVKDLNTILQSREEDTTTAGLVAVYSDLLILQALAVDHFQKPADEEIQPKEKKKEEDEVT